MIQEEVTDDQEILPLFDGKIFAQIRKADWNAVEGEGRGERWNIYILFCEVECCMCESPLWWLLGKECILEWISEGGMCLVLTIPQRGCTYMISTRQHHYKATGRNTYRLVVLNCMLCCGDRWEGSARRACLPAKPERQSVRTVACCWARVVGVPWPLKPTNDRRNFLPHFRDNRKICVSVKVCWLEDTGLKQQCPALLRLQILVKCRLTPTASRHAACLLPTPFWQQSDATVVIPASASCISCQHGC